MERELKLPDVGEGIAEGEIVAWLVEPGDQVTEDQPVAEVETDKAVVEVPSPIDGTVTSLHASEGDVVAVDSVMVTFEVADGDAAAPSATDDSSASDGAVATADEVDADDAADGPTADHAADDAADAATANGTTPASQVIAPPRVKRLARELGVDIGAIDGSGGRVTEAAVRRAAGQQPADATPDEATQPDTTPAVSKRTDAAGSASSADETAESGAAAGEHAADSARQPVSGTADREKTLAAPATRQLARELGVDIDTVPASEERNGQAFVTAADVRASASADESGDSGASQSTELAGAATDATEATGGEERIPYRGIRRTIGKQMEQAKYSAPHVSHHDEVDVTQLQAVRRDLNAELGEGASLTYMPFVMKAVVRALRDHPELNATLDEEREEIVRKHYYNVGVATATDAGLMVPVVRDVDEKGLTQLARDVAEVVDRARSREISPAEMQGGTFTITNFGAIGGDHATPIINYPEAAILGLGAIKKRPMVVEREAAASPNASGDPASTHEVEARTTLPLSLTVDHRLVDGAVAASFTNDVKRYLNNPSLLMI